jgi:hypothetical protein
VVLATLGLQCFMLDALADPVRWVGVVEIVYWAHGLCVCASTDGVLDGEMRRDDCCVRLPTEPAQTDIAAGSEGRSELKFYKWHGMA